MSLAALSRTTTECACHAAGSTFAENVIKLSQIVVNLLVNEHIAHTLIIVLKIEGPNLLLFC
jgi:hypothetical protein